MRENLFRGCARATSIVVLASTVSVGCDRKFENPVSPSDFAGAKSTIRSAVDRDVEPQVVDRFKISLDVVGTLKPKLPITLIATISSDIGAPSAFLTVSSPDEAVASFRRNGRKVRTGERIGVLVERREILPRLSKSSYRIETRFEEPGYYRVAVSAIDSSASISPDGKSMIQNAAVREIWLLVDSTGGRITEHFDRLLIPEGVLAEPGPFRRLLISRPSQSERSSTHSSLLPTAKVINTDDNARDFTVTYWHAMNSQYVDVTNLAMAKVRVWDNYESRYLYEYWVSPVSGQFSLECPTDPTSRHDITLHFNSSDIVFYDDVGNYGSLEPNGCWGLDGQWEVNSSLAHVAVQMREIVQASNPKFGARGIVGVKLDPSATISSYNKAQPWGPSNGLWYSGGDQITLAAGSVNGAIWGSYGAFVQAHEYGHAVHHRALGNYESGTCGSDGHNWGTVEAFPCALAEGFADFFAAVTMPTLIGDFLGYVQDQRDFQSGVFGRQETQVASFLYDLTDDDSAESHDYTWYPFPYIASVLRTCSVSAPSTRRNGIDDMIVCFENLIDTPVLFSYFGNRTPFAFSESAIEPVGGSGPTTWCRQAIRRGWKWNLAREVDNSTLCW